EDHRVPHQARRPQAAAVSADGQGPDREEPSHLRAHALLAAPLPAHARDPAGVAGAHGRARHEARGALRSRRGGRAGLPHAEGVRAGADRRLRGHGRRRVPRLSRAGRRRAAIRGPRRGDRGHVRPAAGGSRRPRAPGHPGRQVPDAAAAGAGREREWRVSRFADARRLARLLRRYVAPYWPALGVLLLTSALATGLAALLPVVMAPILDLALGGARPVPAGGVGLGGLSLTNLGGAVLGWLGASAVDDRFRAIALLCLAYVAVGLVKGWLDFGNYLLALWLRVRAASALQADLFRH